MLEPTPIFERATPYASCVDCWNVLTDEMHSLYLLSFLLTGDLDRANQCLVDGMGECEEEIGVFVARAQAWARRAIIKRAIGIIMPAPDRADDFLFTAFKRSGASGRGNPFGAVVALDAFERFVYVMTVLEKLSDDDCSALLGCSRRDVIIARALACERLVSTHNICDQPVEAVGTWRTMFASHCA